MQIPEELVKKYNIPVPRYTSYPPANFFGDDFGRDNYIQAIKSSNSEWPENISLYIHIPFCPKMCYFCGCNSHVIRDMGKIRSYIDAVKQEIVMVRRLLDPSRTVSQVHWGGGTPNSLSVKMISEIMDVLYDNFTFIEQPEIAIECHPAMLDKDYTEHLISYGFNRFSLGIQDFRREVLDNVNRDAPDVPVYEIVNWIKSNDNIRVNLDFIYGLPFQSIKTFSETIEKAVEISPDRIVTFSYAHVPWIKKAQKILETKGLPDATEKLGMFEAGYRILTENGYVPIGLDHYAKKDDELSIALKNRKLHRNFQGYCTRKTTGQVYAFGATGISQLESAYAQNEKDIGLYIESINQNLLATKRGYNINQAEKIIRHVINEIMCNEYVSLEETSMKFGIAIDEVKSTLNYNPSRFDQFVSDGLLWIEEDKKFELTETGRFFMRNIAAKFDPSLQSGSKQFSKSL